VLDPIEIEAGLKCTVPVFAAYHPGSVKLSVQVKFEPIAGSESKVSV
jgi:hypothetical protein